MQGYLKARAAQARALERHWDVARARTRQSMLGQGKVTAWVTATVTAGVTQCSCSDARCEQGRRQQLVAALGEGVNGSGSSGHESSIARGGGGGGG